MARDRRCALLTSFVLLLAVGTWPLRAQEPEAESHAVAERRAEAIRQNNRAVEALDAGRLEEALEILEGAYRAAPKEAGIAKNLAEALRRRGDASIEKRGYDAARADYARAAELAPQQSTFALLEALVPYRRARWKEADVALARVIERYPHEAEAYLARGSCQVRLLDVKGAVQTWKSGLEVAPEHIGLREAIERYGPEADYEGELYTDLTQNFVFNYHLYEGDVARHAPTLGRDLETAFVAAQKYFLDHFPRERIHVLVYTRGSFRRVTRVEGWVGGLYDGRIRVPVDRYTEERAHLQAVLRHELAHAFAHDLAGGAPPTWLDEGLAQILEGSSHAAAANRLRAGGWPALSALRGPFLGLGDEGRVRAAYDAGLVLCSELERRYGRLALRDYLERIARARQAEDEPEPDPEDLFELQFGLSFEVFVQQVMHATQKAAERR